jgi:ElaA protein
MNLNWNCKHFSELSTEEFHDIIQLRIDVFIVEQNCPYSEIDGKDKNSFHVFGKNENNKIVAVSRILKPGISYLECSIGRVATSKDSRQNGSGIQLMNFTIEKINDIFGSSDIRISAQEYLKSFYEKFGFVKMSESYLEDDIPHIEMLRKV